MTDHDPLAPSPKTAPDGPTLSPAEQVQVLADVLFGDAAPEEFHFQADEMLIKEGDDLDGRPAVLVVQGEIEECIQSYSSDGRPAEHTVYTAKPGDLANVQAVVRPYHFQPAGTTLRAVTEGLCYLVWQPAVEQVPELATLLAVQYRRWAYVVERVRALVVTQEELGDRLSNPSGVHDGAPGPLSTHAVLDEWADIEVDELKRKLEDMRDEFEKAQVAVWMAREQQDEMAKRLDLERRARVALELRLLEMTQQLAEQKGPEQEHRFPTAIRILESTELEEMEAEARRHRELAQSYEARARMLHRAFELLAVDNPGMVIQPNVMQLILGEEPGRLPAATEIASDQSPGDARPSIDDEDHDAPTRQLGAAQALPVMPTNGGKAARGEAKK